MFTSEPGIIPSSEYTGDPKPMGPGEKIGLKWNGDRIELYTYKDYQDKVFELFNDRFVLSNDRVRLQPQFLKRLSP